jgi:hypothetical protein
LFSSFFPFFLTSIFRNPSLTLLFFLFIHQSIPWCWLL